ncbi:hypothetical protein BU14_0345s0003 [Porphyra umbilicalis]|uniref:Uncharacterized protein n=1 Tax=Porphyra umbilicalis TaxID=2786 RepID=A0A1X6NXX2_PORUM|nr:hypothetical protein BU14_0345s0003 [Porphyra umbilicalis]|eukprot:OSX73471.1 hypothetical protein BU14_0345s0003 [Porphyra umbilicalis]
MGALLRTLLPTPPLPPPDAATIRRYRRPPLPPPPAAVASHRRCPLLPLLLAAAASRCRRSPLPPPPTAAATRCRRPALPPPPATAACPARAQAAAAAACRRHRPPPPRARQSSPHTHRHHCALLPPPAAAATGRGHLQNTRGRPTASGRSNKPAPSLPLSLLSGGLCARRAASPMRAASTTAKEALEGRGVAPAGAAESLAAAAQAERSGGRADSGAGDGAERDEERRGGASGASRQGSYVGPEGPATAAAAEVEGSDISARGSAGGEAGFGGAERGGAERGGAKRGGQGGCVQGSGRGGKASRASHRSRGRGDFPRGGISRSFPNAAVEWQASARPLTIGRGGSSGPGASRLSQLYALSAEVPGATPGAALRRHRAAVDRLGSSPGGGCGAAADALCSGTSSAGCGPAG